MTKQPKFLVRVQTDLGVLDVTSGYPNSIQAAQEVQKSLQANMKIIAVYENVGDEDHWNDILNIK